MGNLPTAPRLGPRLPPLPPSRDAESEGESDVGLRAGDLIDGRYQIEGPLGEGGAGVVYRALQMKLHRRVAVKLLQPESDEELRPRFEREAVTLAALSHPNIVSVQDYGLTRGKPFLVMELLQGRTLREVIDEEGALAVTRALTLTREVLRALAYAHDLGIVHRDLKPANLLVQTLPHHEHVKVLDFGFVKLLPGSYLDRGVQLSRVGFTFGTPAYMSPEHATGGNVDGRSDLYSLGILLFEMLTGTKPFEGELSELIRHHLSTPTPRLSERRAELQGRADLQALIDRAMAKDREERFEDAGAFLRSVDGLLSARAEGASIAVLVDEPTSLRTEVRSLSKAVSRFAVASARLARRRARPLLRRARMTMLALAKKAREQLQRAVLTLHVYALALWARTKPQLLRAHTAALRALRDLTSSEEKKSAAGKANEAATRSDLSSAITKVPVGEVRAKTIVLDDPTHLDIIEPRPKIPRASARPPMPG